MEMDDEKLVEQKDVIVSSSWIIKASQTNI